MKKVIRNIIQKTPTSDEKIVQITTVDDRWYSFEQDNPITGLPEYVFDPSVTWTLNYYPKNKDFLRWLGSNGWDEAEREKNEGGDRGSKVHHAIVDLLDAKEIKMEDTYGNSDGIISELTEDEWYCLMAFKDWWGKKERTTLLREYTVRYRDGDVHCGATLDWFGIIDGEFWLIDWKTGGYKGVEETLQVSVCKHGLIQEKKILGLDGVEYDMEKININLATLHLGRKTKTKQGYSERTFKDAIDLYPHVWHIWNNEVSQKNPLTRDYPMTLKLEQGSKK